MRKEDGNVGDEVGILWKCRKSVITYDQRPRTTASKYAGPETSAVVDIARDALLVLQLDMARLRTKYACSRMLFCRNLCAEEAT
jgi:hypothetical protein